MAVVVDDDVVGLDVWLGWSGALTPWDERQAVLEGTKDIRWTRDNVTRQITASNTLKEPYLAAWGHMLVH